jgi:hypothetical protein
MPGRPDDVVRRFAAACRLADVTAIRAALDDDAFAVCDAGGLASAAIGTVHGADGVAELAAGLLSEGELTIEAVNGHAGLALRRAGRAVAVAALQTADGKVTAVWIVLNPVKLRRWR